MKKNQNSGLTKEKYTQYQNKHQLIFTFQAYGFYKFDEKGNVVPTEGCDGERIYNTRIQNGCFNP